MAAYNTYLWLGTYASLEVWITLIIGLVQMLHVHVFISINHDQKGKTLTLLE